MANNFFQKILKKATARDIRGRTKEALKFFRDQVKEFGGSVGPGEILRTAEKKRSSVIVGKMYFMRYNPKHKKTLPFYDRFPLIFPISGGRKSFMGINLHYLPPGMRAILLDSLTALASNKKFDESTKLRLSYNMLKGASKFKLFKPCLKTYLTDHVMSAFAEIPAHSWEMAIWLPLADFKKASQAKVWADSRSQI